MRVKCTSLKVFKNLLIVFFNMENHFGCDGSFNGPFQNCIQQPALHLKWPQVLKKFLQMAKTKSPNNFVNK
jgi:hypothetical protein